VVQVGTLPDLEPVSGYWESDTDLWQFGPASEKTLTMLSCVRAGATTSWGDILHESGGKEAMASLRHAATLGLAFCFEARIRALDGTTKWVRVVGDAPSPNHIRGFITDCTLSKASHGALRNVEMRDLEFEQEDVDARNRVERDLQVSNERLRSLTRVTGAVIGSLPLTAQVQLMAEQVKEAFKVDACVVRLLRGENLHLLASAGIASDQLLEQIPSGEGLPALLMSKGVPLAISDTRRAEGIPPYDPAHYSSYSFVSYAGAPLTVKDQIIGVIGIFMHEEPRKFSEDDLTHLQVVSNNMAVAVLNHELYQQLSDHKATLETNEERLRQVTEASSDAIWEWDRASDTLTWTDRVYELLDLTPTTMATQRIQFLLIVHPDDRKPFFRQIIRHIRVKEPCRIELRLRHGDGSYGIYESIGKLIYDRQDRPTRMVGSIHDISDRVRRDRELEAVAAMSLALREVETTDEMLPVISDQIARTMDLQSLGVALVDPDSDIVQIRHVRGVFKSLAGRQFKKQDGFNGPVFGEAEVKLADDLRDGLDPILNEVLNIPTAVLGVPLVARGEVIGLLWLGKGAESPDAEPTFTQDETRLLGILAEIAAAALRRASFRERTEFHLQRMHSLSIVHATVSENLDLRTTLEMLLEQLRLQTGIHAAAFHLFDEKSGMFRLDTSFGFEIGIVVPPLGRDLILNRYRSKLTELEEGGTRGRRFATMVAAGFESYLAVPLIANENILGVLEIYHKGDLPQRVDLDNFAEMLASQAAIAVDNTNLLKSLRSANKELTSAYDATIEGWARALDLRDHETEGHTRRVTEMTVDLAKLMDVPPNEIAHMKRGALLHDIGKMAIPDNVLLKEGELDQKEWIIMRRHPGIALDLLEPVSFLKPAIDIPFCHHEKWDGTGYPRGLKGKQIPLSARIFSVIDVWDALRSDRPYRKGWSREQAVHYISLQSGRHFDPEVTEIFLKNLATIDRWIR